VGGKDTYRILRKRDLPADFESRHRQFRSVTWTHYVETLADAVPFRKLRLGFAPRNTKTEFSDQDNARRIIRSLAAKSNGAPPPTTRDAADLGPPEAAYELDEQGEERRHVLVGREVPSADLEALVDAAEKLVTAAPPVWSARVHDAPSVSDDATRQLSSTATQDGDDQDQADTHDICHLVAWLKRVTPEWPPMPASVGRTDAG
jgi:hypothetical protein